jgi:alpha-D-ribose 1-methylphosphonate 5-phosphate C-P lyase
MSTGTLFDLACVLCGDQIAPKTEIVIDGEPTGRFRCSPPVQACTDRWYQQRQARKSEGGNR